jgi:hypothetical protein
VWAAACGCSDVFCSFDIVESPIDSTVHEFGCHGFKSTFEFFLTEVAQNTICPSFGAKVEIHVRKLGDCSKQAVACLFIDVTQGALKTPSSFPRRRESRRTSHTLFRAYPCCEPSWIATFVGMTGK